MTERLHLTLPFAVLFAGLVSLHWQAAVAEINGAPTISLKEALIECQQENHQLKLEESEVQRQRQILTAAESALWPSFSSELTRRRYSEDNTVLPIHEVGVFPPLDDDLNEMSLSMNWSLFRGGRNHAAIKSASAACTVADLELLVTRDALFTTIAKVWLQSMSIRDRQVLLDSTATLLNRRLADLEQYAIAGRARTADLSRLMSTIGGIRADSLALAEEEWLLACQLGTLLGTDHAVQPQINPQRNIQLDLVLPEMEVVDPASVLAAQNRLEMQSQALEASRRATWPELTASGNLRTRAGDNLDFHDEWSLALNLRLPLFTGGKLKAQQRQAEAARRSAQTGLDAAQQNANSQREKARLRMMHALMQATALEQSAFEHAVVCNAQRELYTMGRITLDQYLEDELQRLALETEASNKRHQALIAKVDWFQAAGLLSTEIILQTVEALQ